METKKNPVSEAEVRKPNTKLPNNIYLITKSGEKIVHQAVSTTEYEKFYFSTPTSTTARRSKDVILPVAIDKENPRVTTVQELWKILVESYGYKYE